MVPITGVCVSAKITGWQNAGIIAMLRLRATVPLLQSSPLCTCPVLDWTERHSRSALRMEGEGGRGGNSAPWIVRYPQTNFGHFVGVSLGAP